MKSESMRLPSTYWRISAKALILNEENKLLVFMNKDHEWEIPGGGWEHYETFEHCITRELNEEAKVGVASIGDIAFIYKCKTNKGYPKISIAAKVTIDSSVITPSDDDLVDARYVTKEEFLNLNIESGENVIKEYADQIWA